MSRFSAYIQHLQRCLFLWIVIVLIFFIERLLMLNYFVSPNVLKEYQSDILSLFIKGGLFDIQAASYLLAIPFLLGLLCSLLPKALLWYLRFQRYLFLIIFLIALFSAIGNWFYFRVYERQFDVFVFGLLDEDTTSVLKTIWADYPIILGMVFLLLSASAFLYALKKCTKTWCVSHSFMLWILLIFIPIVLLAAGMRASFGKFPLRQSAAQISAAPQLNKLVPNALVSLNWAIREYRNSSVYEKVADADGKRLISQLLDQEASADLAQLLQRTPVNHAVEARPPHVVFTVMESMSAHLLTLSNSERDFLGALRPHWETDWVFSRFISEGDGTSDSLHRFFVRSPRLDLSQSIAKNKRFLSNMFQPYLDAGYRIVYITAGNGGWRDLDNFLRHLGVHEFIDENRLKTLYPEAQSSAWGVPDEYMFRYAAEVLQQAKQPVFIMMLSVTNHPPYRLPKGNQFIDFALTDDEKARLSSLATGQTLLEILNTFRYSNNQLGRFISQVKASAPQTIIAATGDHNMRAIGYPEPNEAALGHGVPFYLYVPEVYRQQAVYQPTRAGSHKDILPTLYQLSLSKALYYETGCNLTAPILTSTWCGYGYNPEVLITEKGFYHQQSKEFRAWSTQNNNLLAAQETPSEITPEDKRPIHKGSAYTEFLNWQINRMVTEQ